MNQETVSSLTREECMEKLKEIGQHCSGTTDDMKIKLRKFCLYPKLYERLKAKCKRQYKFNCSLDPLHIPPVTAKWNSDEHNYSTINEEVFKTYCLNKSQGSKGQQEKAVRMLQSRKIVSVKTIKDNDKIYVKGIIKKSYGTQIRPAVILFENSVPQKAHCSCPVGLSGLCCHVLALLLFLKHYYDTKEKLLELTCTQQIQKWHRRSQKGSIPMVPLAEIKPKSASMKLKDNKLNINAADPGGSYFKRNVPKIITDLQKKLKNEKSVEDHIQNVLNNSKVGRASSVGIMLNYKYHLTLANSLADHDYCKTPLFDSKVIDIEPQKSEGIQKAIDKQYISDFLPEKNTNSEINKITTDKILEQNELKLEIVNPIMTYKDLSNIPLHNKINTQIESKASVIEIDLCFLTAPKPHGDNYQHVTQNTNNWLELRKYKVTGSRLPALLGLYGSSKYEVTWDMIKTGKTEPNQNHIRNIKRGHYFEDIAVKHFEHVANCTTERCGYFHHPINSRYGSSPDALGPLGILLEVKTRAENSIGPLTSIAKFPQYFIQCQLQMSCTNAEFCILQSYHPETATSNFFLIKRNNTLMEIVVQIIDCIYDDVQILEWVHVDILELQQFGKAIVGKIPNFQMLRPVRTFITKNCKAVPKVNFIDELKHAMQ